MTNTEVREPGVVLSFGCGRGELERVLERMPGVASVTGVDPSPGPREMYEGTTLIPEASSELVASADTAIFCESLEHVPHELIDMVLGSMKRGARFITVNWPDYFPIVADSDWDHITRVDNELFDKISQGHDVVIRRGSHLVVDI